jgi:Aldo/keto reductase family
MTMQYVKANSARIPVIGLGTWRSARSHLRPGGRAGFTARLPSHRHGGNVWQRARGWRTIGASGIRRDDVFITTKVWQDHLAPAEIERATKESLVKLCLSKVDLLLRHWPNPRIPAAETIGRTVPDETGGLHPVDRNLELHHAADRGGDTVCDRAARHQPDRIAPVARLIEGGRRVPPYTMSVIAYRSR